MAPLRRGVSQPFPIVEEWPLPGSVWAQTPAPSRRQGTPRRAYSVPAAVLGAFSQLSHGILTVALFPFVDILDAETEA